MTRFLFKKFRSLSLNQLIISTERFCQKMSWNLKKTKFKPEDITIGQKIILDAFNLAQENARKNGHLSFSINVDNYERDKAYIRHLANVNKYSTHVEVHWNRDPVTDYAVSYDIVSRSVTFIVPTFIYFRRHTTNDCFILCCTEIMPYD